MGNRVISYSLRGIEAFLHVPMIIIIKFGETNVLGTIYINTEFQGWAGGWYMVHLTLFCLLFIKNKKIQE